MRVAVVRATWEVWRAFKGGSLEPDVDLVTKPLQRQKLNLRWRVVNMV
jgi:hypothetical protein